MSKHLLPGALVALSLLVAAPVLAVSGSSSATVDTIKLELIDLAPEDGITPALVFTSNAWNAYVFARGLDEYEVPGTWERVWRYGDTSVILNENVLVATTHAEPAPAGTSYYLNGQATREATFTLTPNTGLRFSAHAQLHVDAHDVEYQMAGYGAALTLTRPLAFLDQTSAIARSFSLYENGDRDFDLQFDLASGDRMATGTLTLNAWSSLQAISAVPEPASYSMLLAGAALLGAMGRWRRRA